MGVVSDNKDKNMTPEPSHVKPFERIDVCGKALRGPSRAANGRAVTNNVPDGTIYAGNPARPITKKE
jgi:hypothetical protein